MSGQKLLTPEQFQQLMQATPAQPQQPTQLELYQHNLLNLSAPIMGELATSDMAPNKAAGRAVEFAKALLIRLKLEGVRVPKELR